ncbi:hypothetical protein K9B33_05940 [Sphingobium sp. 3R8]|uniref:hypothetical protein n=1 Tax=Sphingobium sp. 3R8 TaxID=2874921 RepID=UPI001CC98011|nr:hypothetical protein [Sphingobium sp. 3R8]MBZ9647075.1 hypothetical protein [Sphingobium sp. 3R8]
MTLLLWYLNWLYVPVILILSALWGGKDERIGVCLFLLALVGTHFATSALPIRYRSVELDVLLIDGLLAAALIALSLKSDRFWPLWATSFHLLTIYTHMAMLMAVSIVAFPYAFLAGWWAWPTLLSMVIGAYGYHRRKRQQKLAA